MFAEATLKGILENLRYACDNVSLVVGYGHPLTWTDLPLQARWVMRWCASNCSSISSKYIEYMGVVMLWCALWEVVDGIRDEWELVEQLLYWSRDGE